MKIILLGNPKSTQNSYRFHSRGGYLTKDARLLKNSYISQVKQQWKDTPIDYDISVHIILFFGDKRRRDWDNFHKLSMDALSDIVFVDDCQIRKAIVELEYDKENPRIEIAIEKLLFSSQ